MPISKLALKKRAAALKVAAAKTAAIHEHMRLDAEEAAREAAAIEEELLAAHVAEERSALGVQAEPPEPTPAPELISLQLPRSAWQRFKDLW